MFDVKECVEIMKRCLTLKGFAQPTGTFEDKSFENPTQYFNTSISNEGVDISYFYITLPTFDHLKDRAVKEEFENFGKFHWNYVTSEVDIDFHFLEKEFLHPLKPSEEERVLFFLEHNVEYLFPVGGIPDGC